MFLGLNIIMLKTREALEKRPPPRLVYKCGNQGRERCSDLTASTQPVGGQAGTWAQAPGSALLLAGSSLDNGFCWVFHFKSRSEHFKFSGPVQPQDSTSKTGKRDWNGGTSLPL